MVTLAQPLALGVEIIWNWVRGQDVWDMDRSPTLQLMA